MSGNSKTSLKILPKTEQSEFSLSAYSFLTLYSHYMPHFLFWATVFQISKCDFLVNCNLILPKRYFSVATCIWHFKSHSVIFFCDNVTIAAVIFFLQLRLYTTMLYITVASLILINVILNLTVRLYLQTVTFWNCNFQSCKVSHNCDFIFQNVTLHFSHIASLILINAILYLTMWHCIANSLLISCNFKLIMCKETLSHHYDF